MNIIDKILIDRAKEDELIVFLTSFFGSVTETDIRTIKFGDKLIIKFNKEDRIKSIDYDADSETIKKLITEAHEAVFGDSGKEIGSEYIFSYFSINQFYRYQDYFQILPPHQDAPKPDKMVFGKVQPIKLEFGFDKSTNILVNIFRKQRACREIILLLNILLKYGITYDRHNQAPRWVNTKIDEGSDIKLLSSMYYANNDERGKDLIGFTKIDYLEPIEKQDYNSYYTDFGIDIEHRQIQIPNNIDYLLNIYYSLSPEDRELILRSSYWTEVSYNNHLISLSASYTALITAIEVFLPNPSARCIDCGKEISEDKCPSCYQPVAGPTKHFRDFVEEYASGIEEKTRKELYSIRSKITHGGYLFPSDRNGYRNFDSESINEQKKYDILLQIVRIIQINWLLKKKI